MMWRVYLYPLWKITALERYLEYMESCGFRLECVYWRYIFRFAKSPPKKVRYLYSYSFVKEYEMHLYEHEIRREYNANPIMVKGLDGTSVHRVCSLDADLTDFKNKRNWYLRRLVLKRIAFSVIYFLGSFCAAIEYKCLFPWIYVVTLGILFLITYYVICYVIFYKGTL